MSDFEEATKPAETVTVKEPSSDSQPETVETKEPTPSQEESKAVKPEDSAPDKEIPFHKHPRWIKTQEELKELREIASRIAEQKAAPKEEPQAPKVTEVPKQYKRLFGEDVEAFLEWKQFQRDESRQEAQALFEEMKAKEKQETSAAEEYQKKAAQFAEDEFLKLSDDTGIALTNRDNTERNQILDICFKKNIFTEKGFPNIALAYEFWKLSSPQKINPVEEKKKIVAKTNAKTSAASTEEEFYTPAKLKKMRVSQFFN